MAPQTTHQPCRRSALLKVKAAASTGKDHTMRENELQVGVPTAITATRAQNGIKIKYLIL